MTMMMIVKAFRSERGLVGNRFASNDSQLHASSSAIELEYQSIAKQSKSKQGNYSCKGF